MQAGVPFVAIPCFQDQETVTKVVCGVLRFVDVGRVVVVDDGSDPPVRSADVGGVLVLRHDTNRGLSAAMATAVRYVLDAGASGLVKLDADGQMDTDALPRFLDALAQGYEVVLGTFDPARTPWSEWFADELFRRLFWLGTGSQVPTVLADYRAYGPRALELLAAESLPPWAFPLTLFPLRCLRRCCVERCIGFLAHRDFSPAGMLQLRLTFLGYLARERSLRGRAAAPVAAAALFAHMGAVLVARWLRPNRVRLRSGNAGPSART